MTQDRFAAFRQKLKDKIERGDLDPSGFEEDVEPIALVVWRDVAREILEQEFPQQFYKEVWGRYDREFIKESSGIDSELWEAYNYLLADAAETIREGINEALEIALMYGEARIGESLYAAQNTYSYSEQLI